MKNIEVIDIKRAYTKLGYELFEDDSKAFNLNLIGVRSKDVTPNKYNDVFLALWKYKGGWNKLSFACTTEAGLYYLKHPLNTKGTAILKEGRYPSMWSNGKHQGKYDALKQTGSCTVIRDFDCDDEFDYDSGVEETGLFGINGHRASEHAEGILVNRYSAACQVIANPDEFKMLIRATLYGAQNWGNSFTYTLINENDL